jgi:hypothetical protein
MTMINETTNTAMSTIISNKLITRSVLPIMRFVIWTLFLAC